MLPTTPIPPPAPRGGGINRTAVILAFVVAAVTLPFIVKFQLHRYDATNAGRHWRMLDLRGITQSEATKRFGKPLIVHTFPLGSGAVMGPDLGLKHYYLNSAPDFAERKKKAEVIWTFPQYTTIREVLWKLPDSVLTVWFHEPRAEIDLSGEEGQITLPDTAGGEWVAIDNYRVGSDLVKGTR